MISFIFLTKGVKATNFYDLLSFSMARSLYHCLQKRVSWESCAVWTSLLCPCPQTMVGTKLPSLQMCRGAPCCRETSGNNRTLNNGSRRTGTDTPQFQKQMHVKDHRLLEDIYINLNSFQKRNQETVTFPTPSWAAVVGEDNKCHETLWNRKHRDSTNELGTHSKDTQYRPMCAVTAMYYFFHQKVDTQNIQEIGVPFQTSNWDFFPGDSVFI